MSIQKEIHGRTQNSLAVVWREMLVGIFSTLGRMARLAHCYHPSSNQYYSVQVAQKLKLDEADHALRLTHGLVWSDWLNGSLQEQEADLRLYLSGSFKEMAQALAEWRVSRPFLSFPPISATAEERSLFSSNLEILLRLLCNQHGVESAPPSISSSFG